MKITLKLDKAALAKAMKTVEKQVDYAFAKAATKSVQTARLDLMAALPKVFDRPTPYTLRGIGYKPANKQNLTASVFIRESQATYLGLQVKGGIERPRRRALLKPAAIPLNAYGNMTRTAVKRLLAKKNVFSAEVNGTPGIWERTRNGLKLRVRYKSEQQVRPRFDFYAIGRKSIEKNFGPNFNAALRQALATAR